MAPRKDIFRPVSSIQRTWYLRRSACERRENCLAMPSSFPSQSSCLGVRSEAWFDPGGEYGQGVCELRMHCRRWKRGVIIVADSEDRENEGDFLAAASTIDASIIHFMTAYGRGQLCMPACRPCTASAADSDGRRCVEYERARFTIPVDHRCRTTGISPSERAFTIRAMLDPDNGAEDFIRPGHIFPLIARPGGLLEGTGHTESTVESPAWRVCRPPACCVRSAAAMAGTWHSPPSCSNCPPSTTCRSSRSTGWSSTSGTSRPKRRPCCDSWRTCLERRAGM